MSRRASVESRIITYFRCSPLEQAEMMLGLVKEEVKSRQKASVPAVTRKPRRKKTTAATQSSGDSGA